MDKYSVAAVFPGQGSQKPGMAKDFYKEYEVVRRTFEEAADALGEDLTAVCFEENPKLYLTEYGQPCILTVEIAMTRVLVENYNFSPEYMAGHSLGEYAALVMAGVLPFATGVQIARERARLMQQAVPVGEGSMSAIKLQNIENRDYRTLVEGNGAEVANYNSPNQIVISGQRAAVEKAGAALHSAFASDGIEVIALEVSAPFHCSLMRPIEKDFRDYLNGHKAKFALEKCAGVVANFTAEFHSPGTVIDNLVGQLSGSVRWVHIMRLLAKYAHKVYEVGPSRPLGAFFRAIDVEVKSIVNLRSVSKAFSKKAAA